MAGVPTRLVGGYLGGTYNDLGGYYAVTEDRAHVWVEAFVTERGWVTIDPSRWAVNFAQARTVPPPGLMRRAALLLDTGSYYWNAAVINYDLERQFSAANRLVSLSRNVRLSWLKGWLWPILATVAALLLLPHLIRRLRTSREERLVRSVLRRVRHAYGITPGPETGLHTLAADTGDPALMELVSRYEYIVFRDRRLSRREAAQLRKLSRKIGKKKGLQSDSEYGL
jgi:hypothetical protein